MYCKKIYWTLLLFTLCLFSTLYAEQKSLKSSDVKEIMQQLFKQHLDHKDISSNLIKISFKNYIDHFDPNGTYLLEEEVHPYLNLTDSQVTTILDQYRQNNFSTYEKLNTTIQNAIERARKYRKEILQDNQNQLFTPNLDVGTEAGTQPFPKNLKELKARIKLDMMQFISLEKQRFGSADVMKNKAQIIALYETHMRKNEDPYMAVDQQGKPHSKIEQENQFSVHILKALASALDAHSEFLNQDEAYDMSVRLKKEFSGIGVKLESRPEGIIIAGVIPGSPAAKDGRIKVNDLLTAIDGKEVSGEPITKVVERIHGNKGAPVALTLKRSGDGSDRTIQVQLARAEIEVAEGRVETATEKFGNGIIGIITLHSFYQGANGSSSSKDVREAIEKLSMQGHLRGLILDLRDNTGGFLVQAVKIAGLFISSGVIVVSKYFNGEESFYRDVDGKSSYEGPLVILTSKETASAAEIVAQALQDYGVALIIGDERTFGKGTIQSQTVTENAGAPFFKVTVGKYYTVSGKTPQLKGVRADIVAPSQFSQIEIGEEYLENPIPPDAIPPEYSDDLKGIEPGMHSWYLHYYTPHLQHKETMWRNMLPTLKKNSKYRIEQNKNYQAFLKDPLAFEKDSKDKKGSSDFGHVDVQLNEGINVVKDMISLESKARKEQK